VYTFIGDSSRRLVACASNARAFDVVLFDIKSKSTHASDGWSTTRVVDMAHCGLCRLTGRCPKNKNGYQWRLGAGSVSASALRRLTLVIHITRAACGCLMQPRPVPSTLPQAA
jgi:hypothetical protein